MTTNILAQSLNEMVTNVKTPKAIETASTVGPCVSIMLGNKKIDNFVRSKDTPASILSVEQQLFGWGEEELRPNADSRTSNVEFKLLKER